MAARVSRFRSPIPVPATRLYPAELGNRFMNEAHLKICSSPEWASYVASELLPWVLASYELGDDVLEVGPGPGLTTDLLRHMVPRLTVIEIDESLAAQLARRLAGTNVTVLHGDGTQLPFKPARFSAATLFTMLHHVPSVALQDRLLREVRRVLRPRGLLVGTDGLDTPERREVHAGDIFVPIHPAALPNRMRAAGFADPVVEEAGDRIRFAARAPS
ncbi:MAG: class I SAM-dependent methyltransferase [Chloroflexi bacterium]|nr:MAG: class I SAM-dependent methyltransferase [Chloroflexota bacterium]